MTDTQVSFYWMSEGKKVAGPWQTHDAASDTLRNSPSMVKVVIDNQYIWIPKKDISVYSDETEDHQ